MLRRTKDPDPRLIVHSGWFASTLRCQKLQRYFNRLLTLTASMISLFISPVLLSSSGITPGSLLISEFPEGTLRTCRGWYPDVGVGGGGGVGNDGTCSADVELMPGFSDAFEVEKNGIL